MKNKTHEQIDNRSSKAFLDLKRSEEMLHQSEEKYRVLIENIRDGIFIIQDAKLKFVNEAFARIAGYCVEEIIGMDFRDLVAPEDKELVVDRYTRRLKGEKVPAEYEFRLIQKGGTIITVDMNVGAFTYFGRIASIGILKDITQRKFSEEKLRQHEIRLEDMLKLHRLGDATEREYWISLLRPVCGQYEA